MSDPATNGRPHRDAEVRDADVDRADVPGRQVPGASDVAGVRPDAAVRRADAGGAAADRAASPHDRLAEAAVRRLEGDGEAVNDLFDDGPDGQHRHRVVVVGGGFGGLNVVRGLKRAPVAITLVDRRNHHLFQPLLYQVATGSLSPANIAAPLRGITTDQRNCEVLLAEVTGFDPERRRVELDEGFLVYDTLVVAAGSTHSYFGHDEWAPFAPGLKNIEDAIEIRRRVLLAFEEAERCTDPACRRTWMTFVIVGGGPTGVELAGSIAEIARQTLRDDFRRINPADCTILLADGGDRVLKAFDPELSAYAADALEKLGVALHLNTRVTDVNDDACTLTPGGGGEPERVRCRTVIWAAGVQASGLANKLADLTDADADRAGRVRVEQDCTLRNRPEVFAIGDMANFPHNADRDRPLPGVAQVALQQGKYVAKEIRRRLRGDTAPPKPFKYKDRGTMATIGRRKAVADVFDRYHATGFPAWLMWLAVHVVYIVSFQSRLLVLIQWGWNYLTFTRSARLITGQTLPVAHRLTPAADGGHESLGRNPLSERRIATPAGSAAVGPLR